MNGVMPGPLWLAIASGASNNLGENGTLTHPSKNATVTRKMTDRQNDTTDRGRNGHADSEGELHPRKPDRKRLGG